MNKIFVDASYWIGLRDTGQPKFKRASQIAAQLMKQRTFLVTTNLVFAEIHAFFSRHPGLSNQIIRDFCESEFCRVHLVDLADHAAALELLRRSRDKTYSYCDAVSFGVMRRLEIHQALSFDQHFRQIGEFEIIS